MEDAAARERRRESFTVMAKPVGPLCNLACDYCYYTPTRRLYESSQHFRMSEETLETFIRQYLAASPDTDASFVWHGGEPTLAGLDFFRKAVELQRKYLPPGRSCWNNLQTNGILLDDDWSQFLAENNFDVGLSVDGTEELHDAHRKDHNGEGSYQRVAEAARRLKAQGIRADILCTVNADTAKAPLAVYNALRELDTGWIQFIPVLRRDEETGALTQDSVTGEAYGRFLISVFNEWAANDIGRLEVQMFAEMTLILSGRQASVCWMAPTCGRALVLEHDGTVYSCDHFVKPDYRLGNIKNEDMGDLAASPFQRRFGVNKREALPRQCLECPWLNLCQGGCLKDRFAISDTGEPGLNALCVGQRRFFAYAAPPLKRILELRRQKIYPALIMGEMRNALRRRWEKAGRNDPCPCGSGIKAKHCCKEAFRPNFAAWK